MWTLLKAGVGRAEAFQSRGGKQCCNLHAAARLAAAPCTSRYLLPCYSVHAAAIASSGPSRCKQESGLWAVGYCCM